MIDRSGELWHVYDDMILFVISSKFDQSCTNSYYRNSHTCLIKGTREPQLRIYAEGFFGTCDADRIH